MKSLFIILILFISTASAQQLGSGAGAVKKICPEGALTSRGDDGSIICSFSPIAPPSQLTMVQENCSQNGRSLIISYDYELRDDARVRRFNPPLKFTQSANHSIKTLNVHQATIVTVSRSLNPPEGFQHFCELRKAGYRYRIGR